MKNSAETNEHLRDKNFIKWVKDKKDGKNPFHLNDIAIEKLYDEYFLRRRDEMKTTVKSLLKEWGMIKENLNEANKYEDPSYENFYIMNASSYYGNANVQEIIEIDGGDKTILHLDYNGKKLHVCGSGNSGYGLSAGKDINLINDTGNGYKGMGRASVEGITTIDKSGQIKSTSQSLALQKRSTWVMK